ncbi:amidase [Oceanisphaera ostreae]|uniref:Amidase n=1 Tax=Oceanisphaera ostreae TaxID=914151 RepID=A0ABW3KJR5_9GAMM
MSSRVLNKLGLCETLALISQREVTALEVINAYFDQIEAREAAVGAWQERLTREQYLQQYHEQENFYRASLLQGLPLAIKDTIDTQQFVTEMGSAIHKGRQPADNASCIEALVAAGAKVLGKTVTTEFAYFKPGKTANPVNLQHTPGGSSSGSAAAVADGMVSMALGSQTAASVIRPAAYCGVVGYVGSKDEYSLRGIQPLAQSLDSLGVFGRKVEDIELLRSILLQQAKPAADLPQPLKVLVCKGSEVGDCDVQMEQALTQFAEQLQQGGAELITLDACDLIRQLVMAHETIMAWEVCRNLYFEAQHVEQVSEPLHELFIRGQQMQRSEYLAAHDKVAKINHWLWSHPKHQGVDVILAPAAPSAAPAGLNTTGKPHMSRPWQVMGLPVVTVPHTAADSGLPLGIQLIGRSRADDQLLAIANWAQTLLNR